MLAPPVLLGMGDQVAADLGIIQLLEQELQDKVAMVVVVATTAPAVEVVHQVTVKVVAVQVD